LISENDSANAELQGIVAAFQERFHLYSELPAQAAGMFGELPEWDKKARKALAADGAADAAEKLAAALEDVAWPPEDFMAVVKEVAGELEVGLGKVMKPVRAALTGTLGGPELDAVVKMLGRDRVLKRLRELPAAAAR
jgi:glutamyl-tRNA synthetase